MLLVLGVVKGRCVHERQDWSAPPTKFVKREIESTLFRDNAGLDADARQALFRFVYGPKLLKPQEINTADNGNVVQKKVNELAKKVCDKYAKASYEVTPECVAMAALDAICSDNDVIVYDHEHDLYHQFLLDVDKLGFEDLFFHLLEKCPPYRDYNNKNFEIKDGNTIRLGRTKDRSDLEYLYLRCQNKSIKGRLKFLSILLETKVDDMLKKSSRSRDEWIKSAINQCRIFF